MNIILLICHDLGRELGCYGAGVQTPHLDRFAADGIRFNRAYCASPACSPSRGCMVTGQHAHTNGLMGLVNGGWHLPPEAQTIQDYLNAAGWDTVHSGMQHERRGQERNRYAHEIGSGSSAEEAVAGAVAFLEERARGSANKPFYLNIGTMETHESMWNSRLARGGNIYDEFNNGQAHVPVFLPDLPSLQREIARFRAATRLLDREFGRLVAAVDRLGFTDNTLILFITDHGIGGARSKGTLYPRGLEISLLIRGPNVHPGQTCEQLISNIDICPTLLEFAGVPIPPQIQGRSFQPLLSGGKYQPREALFFERNYHGALPPETVPPPPLQNPHYDPMRAVMTERFHFIRNFRDGLTRAWRPEEVSALDDEAFKTWTSQLWPRATELRSSEELFDLRCDPHHSLDLSEDPKYSDIKAQLKDRLNSWMHETDDPLLKGHIPDRLNSWI